MAERTDGGVLGAIRGRYSARLGVALLAAVAILVVFGFVVQAQTATQVREETRRDLTLAAEVQANAMDEWISGNRRQARSISALPVMATDDPDQISDELSEIVEQGHVSEEVAAINYVNLQQQEIAASSNPNLVGGNLAEQQPPFLSKVQQGFNSSDEVYVSRPFTIGLVDHPIIAVVTPVEGVEARLLVVVINPTGQTEELRQPVEGGVTRAVDSGGRLLAGPSRMPVNQTLAGQQASLIDQALSEGAGVVNTGQGEVVGFASLESKDWVIFVHAPTENAFALSATVRSDLVGLILLAVISLGLVGVTIGSNTAIALRLLSTRAREMGEGNLDVPIRVSRADEIGVLASSLSDMRDSLRQTLTEVEDAREVAERRRRETEAMNEHLETKAAEYGEALSAIADGDLARRVDPESDSEAMAEVGRSINETVADLAETVADVTEFAERVSLASREVDAGASEVRRASEEVSDSVQEISDGATEQSQMLANVSDEMEALSATAEEVASSSDQLAVTSEEAAEAGAAGQQAAQTAIEEMNEVEAATEAAVEDIEALDEEMEAIGDVVELISDIAEQTNILALNASIEAARAGVEGEGFAVVAEEVKTLAGETMDAAEDIEGRIRRIQDRTGETVEGIQETRERLSAGVETVEEAIGALDRIADHVEDTDKGVQNISAATAQQADSAQSVVALVEELTSISEQTTNEAENVAAAAEEQTATLSNVSEQAGDLATRASELQELLETFEVNGAAQPTPDDGAEVPVEED